MPGPCLIGEADPFIATLLLRFVEKSGLHGAQARTGQEILSLVERINPNVLIVEPQLPGKIRGWEAVQTIRSSGTVRSMAVISCSWLEKSETCKLIGDVVWHLQKPDLYYADFVKALEAAGIGPA